MPMSPKERIINQYENRQNPRIGLSWKKRHKDNKHKKSTSLVNRKMQVRNTMRDILWVKFRSLRSPSW